MNYVGNTTETDWNAGASFHLNTLVVPTQTEKKIKSLLDYTPTLSSIHIRDLLRTKDRSVKAISEQNKSIVFSDYLRSYI